MLEIISLVVSPIASSVAAFISACVFVFLLHLFNQTKRPWFPYFIYCLIFSSAISILLSDRNFALNGEFFQSDKNTISEWLTRLTSIFAIVASIDIISRHILRKNRETKQAVLIFSFVFFWLATVGLTSIFGAYSTIKLNFLYPLFLGIAGLLCTEDTKNELIKATRNSVIAFTCAGLSLSVIKPDMVLDFTYAQGYIPGLPRFAGLSPHAIANAVFISIGLLCLKFSPLQSRSQNIFFGAVCFSALLLTQAKATIFGFAISYLILDLYQDKESLENSKPKPLKLFSVLAIISFGFILAGAAISGRFDNLLQPQEATRLASFTGRDVIWEVALNEWKKYPIFGYGLLLFGDEHRIAIRMPFATGGHNQIIDTLGRSGSLGLIGLLTFVFTALYYSIRNYKLTAGFSIALFSFFILRFMTEIPLQVQQIGLETAALLVFLALLASSSNKFNSKNQPQRSSTNKLPLSY